MNKSYFNEEMQKRIWSMQGVKTISKENAVKLASSLYGLDEMAATVFIDKYIPRFSYHRTMSKTVNNVYYEEGDIKNFFTTIAKHIAATENAKISKKTRLSETRIFELINKFKYLVLGGSVMAGVVKDKFTSLGNCFVVGTGHDSYNSITQTGGHAVNILKRRGGVGTDFSHLRERGSLIHNAAEESTGVVPFVKRFSNTILEVSQAKGRRGEQKVPQNYVNL